MRLMRRRVGGSCGPIVASLESDAARGLGAVLEAPALVACLDDVAVMREAIEQRRGRFRIAKHARPFAEGEIGGDDDRCSLVRAGDEMKQELSVIRRAKLTP